MRRGTLVIIALALAAGPSWAQGAPAAPAPASASPAPSAAVEPAKKPRLMVNELKGLETSAQQAAAFTDAVVNSLNARKLFEVVSTRDVEALIGAERQKQLRGVCDADPNACVSDALSQLNARFLLTGQLARVGGAFQLTLQMVDTEKGSTVARSTRLAGSLEALRELVPYAAAEATGMPLPPPPSRVLPVSLMVAGGAAVVAGGVVGLLALFQQQQLNDELCPGGVVQGARCTGVNLRPRDFYLQKQGDLANRQALAIGLLAGGVVLAGVGYWLLPASPKDGVAVRLLPSTSGFALVGVFP